jgi:cell division septation protein DedD
MAAVRKRGARERVLEGRHVIGLFMLMLVFSGVFFTLGYVMGRSQYDGQVRAAGNPHAAPDAIAARKAETAAAKRSRSAPMLSEPATDVTSQPNSDWGFYDSGRSITPDDNLKPAPPATPVRALAAPRKPRSLSRAFSAPAGAYTLQVAALRREADALSLAAGLQKRGFPAFVVSPQRDKYFHVQVGPYSDQKSADTAKKGLEGAGFRAIVKH